MPSQRNISLLSHPNCFNSGCYDVNVCLFGNKKTCKNKFKKIKNSARGRRRELSNNYVIQIRGQTQICRLPNMGHEFKNDVSVKTLACQTII